MGHKIFTEGQKKVRIQENKYKSRIIWISESRNMANTKIFIFDEDIKYLQRTKIMRTERKLEENIESLDKWSRIWQIPKYLYLMTT